MMKLTLLLLLFFCACTPLRARAEPIWLRAFFATLTPTATATPTATHTPRPTPTPVELSFPIRAAFYEPGYPQDWLRSDGAPATRYHPDLGQYSLDDPAVIPWQISALKYARIQVGIAVWRGPGDGRIPQLLAAAEDNDFFWALQVPDSPDSAAIQANLAAIHDSYASSPAYLRLSGRFVVIANADGLSDINVCEMADRWVQSNTVGAYLALPAFDGYADCAAQPDVWLPDLPAGAPSAEVPSGYAIRPGEWRAGEDQPGLTRDLLRWAGDVRAMVASGAKFQLVDSFNDWTAGSAVEDAREWPSASGFGYYLDALHFDGDLAQLFPYRVALPLVRHDIQVTLVGAGDIASWHNINGAYVTADLLGQFPGAQIFTAGDNVQDNGAAFEYQEYFNQTWGRYKDRIHPSPGNHDIGYEHMNPYYDYFGAAAGERDKGYYSYDLGAWHIIALNSNCPMVGGCETGSPEEQWLKADLAAHPALCTLAYWHHPLYGWLANGPHPEMAAFWRDLYDAGVELVINGHDHDYERFAPQDPNGNIDRQHGIREIVAGTGGAGSDPVDWPMEPNSEVRIIHTWGLLKLDLSSDRYAWQYVPAPGQPGADSGWDICH